MPTTVSIAELRTALAVARLLAEGIQPRLPYWNAKTVRAFASSLTGAEYRAGKAGMRQVVAHLARAVELAEEAR